MPRYKLNETIIKRIQTNLSVGQTQRDAAVNAGLSESGFYKYMGIGYALLEEKPLPSNAPPSPKKKRNESKEKFQSRVADHDRYMALCEKLVESVKKGQAVVRSVMVAHVLDAAEKDWRAAAWFLERTMPDEFALQGRVTHQVEGTVVHQHKSVDKLAGIFRDIGVAEKRTRGWDKPAD